MSLQQELSKAVIEIVEKQYNVTLPLVEITPTRKDQKGDVTVMVFPMLRHIKGNPAAIGQAIGDVLLQQQQGLVKGIEVIKGFLNLTIAHSYYNERLRQTTTAVPENDATAGVMVEYSSPNTNKPLHLGHVRNNLLGYSVAQIIEATGREVNKTQIINDRGIHICKSMLAWQRFGNGETPLTTGLKGDKLVGNYYVKFDQEYKKEIATLIEAGKTEEEAKKEAPILIDAQEMLRQWEAGDKDVVSLWKTMNQWVYDGFDTTYKSLGVQFDSYYFESNTYLLGKDVVNDGLEKGVFYRKEDGSVWIDLTEEGLDEKIVLRSDGTAVYMTQDIGTAIQRVKDHNIDSMVYTVGNEQDYHFKVLFLILQKLGFDWANNLFHLSYGMVDLPSGKMKSREGTVVDADELIDEMTNTARQLSQELGKLDGMSEEEKEALYRTIGLGALKYYILKVDPKKRILFDPKESVDFQGNTGPFIQYTYARIQSILRKSKVDTSRLEVPSISLSPKEVELIKLIDNYQDTVQLAASKYSPALVANYTYELVKEFNSFYQQHSILQADTDEQKTLRLILANKTAQVIKAACQLMGIEVPERM